MNGQEIIILIQGEQLQKAVAPLRMNGRESLRMIRHLIFLHFLLNGRNNKD